MSTITDLYVVDDDALVRRSTVMMLNAAGFTARPFGGGADFIEELEWLKPGCVLLDVRMPEMDGLGVLAALSGSLARFPVIVMTGHGDVATAVQAMKLGATDFLEKPFEESDLFGILDGMGAEDSPTARHVEDRKEAQQKLATLSAREKEVLDGLIAGLPNKLVADRLSLSIRTVEMHRANLMEKLGARALADALRIAFHADLRPS